MLWVTFVAIYLSIVSGQSPAPADCPAPKPIAPYTCKSDGLFPIAEAPKVTCIPQYYQCVQKKPYLQTCLWGMIFNPVTQSCASGTSLPYCDIPATPPKITDPFTCPSDGLFPAVPVEVPCDITYNQCYALKPYVQSCVLGNVFDPFYKVCVAPSTKYYCTKPAATTTSASTTGTSSTPTSGTTSTASTTGTSSTPTSGTTSTGSTTGTSSTPTSGTSSTSTTGTSSTASTTGTSTAPSSTTTATTTTTFTCAADGYFPTTVPAPELSCVPQYFYCLQGKAYLMNCLGGNIFDPIFRVCGSSTAWYCSKTSKPDPMAACAYKCPADGFYPAVPMDVPCNVQYNLCSGKKPYQQSCLWGQVFDPFWKSCTNAAYYCKKP